jgi:hypothetical protein
LDVFHTCLASQQGEIAMNSHMAKDGFKDGRAIWILVSHELSQRQKKMLDGLLPGQFSECQTA